MILCIGIFVVGPGVKRNIFYANGVSGAGSMKVRVLTGVSCSYDSLSSTDGGDVGVGVGWRGS